MARLIDAEAVLEEIRDYIDEYSLLDENGYHNGKWCAMKEAEDMLENAPTVDAVPVVRCLDCVKWEEYDNTAGNGYCLNKRYMFRYGGIGGRGEMEFNPITEPEFSCADGKRKGGSE